MKVVIDTNILVSAAIRDGIPEIVIQFIVDRPEFEWIVSQEIEISKNYFVINQQRSPLSSLDTTKYQDITNQISQS